MQASRTEMNSVRAMRLAQTGPVPLMASTSSPHDVEVRHGFLRRGPAAADPETTVAAPLAGIRSAKRASTSVPARLRRRAFPGLQPLVGTARRCTNRGHSGPHGAGSSLWPPATPAPAPVNQTRTQPAPGGRRRHPGRIDRHNSRVPANPPTCLRRVVDGPHCRFEPNSTPTGRSPRCSRCASG
jgi:hypothetical protein